MSILNSGSISLCPEKNYHSVITHLPMNKHMNISDRHQTTHRPTNLLSWMTSTKANPVSRCPHIAKTGCIVLSDIKVNFQKNVPMTLPKILHIFFYGALSFSDKRRGAVQF